MSQPPYQPAPHVPAGTAVQQPAAPTQIVFPGQVQLPPQPQFAPSPQQSARLPQGTLATGFPNYVPPPPSPVNRTSLYVGILVCLLTVAFAVLGFLVVG
ncbi:hypothetical protein JOD57_004023 [Geodermatophilus bullaregiensis]|uniref:hypothetical protein n=1 Tax=Geodermatophilus bullaregiensis TaxID=1564160 RepID=UPI001956BD74|nr:hypothetical protein [Geodermatophilus bullaregiensis]MBM7808186.1 hypothetical protein [Geodermatophilus bullaregiensis]